MIAAAYDTNDWYRAQFLEVEQLHWGSIASLHTIVKKIVEKIASQNSAPWSNTKNVQLSFQKKKKNAQTNFQLVLISNSITFQKKETF